MCSNIKLADFIAADAEFWYSIIEAEFECLKEDKSDIKFRAVLGALPEHVLVQVSVKEAVMSDKVEERYEKLKKAVIEVSEDWECSRVVQLLEREKRGYRGFVEFLKHLRTLKVDGMNVSNAVLKTLLENEMPEKANQILKITRSGSTTPEDLASRADALLETGSGMNPPTRGVTKKRSGQSIPQMSDSGPELNDGISELRNELNTFSLKFNDQSVENARLNQTCETLKKLLLSYQEEYRGNLQDLEGEIQGLKRQLTEEGCECCSTANETETLPDYEDSDEETDAASLSNSSGDCPSSGFVLPTRRSVHRVLDGERTLCYFHMEYGKRTFKCEKGCDWDLDDEYY